MESKIFSIKCITNLHVGAGSTTAGIVDNEVQRDSITKYPIIHSSSLKGALRAHLKEQNVPEAELDSLFGKTKKGELRFMDAYLSAMPLRCMEKPYVLATSETIKRELNEKLMVLGKPKITNPKNTDNDLTIEDLQGQYPEQTFDSLDKYFFGERTIVLDADESIFCSLPVIARNSLEDGRSANLWYEEMVPRESRFWVAVLGEKAMLDQFASLIKQNRFVQIGANATIGYGYTEILEVPFQGEA
jgi:CRISPR-associated protein Cmr4